MTRADAIERTLATLRFFWTSPQGTEPDATGYRGFYYHFLDMKTGRRAWLCELSTIDTAFLLAGMLTAAAYFDRGHARPSGRSARLADALYRRADWPWAHNGGATVTHGWKPESGFLPLPLGRLRRGACSCMSSVSARRRIRCQRRATRRGPPPTSGRPLRLRFPLCRPAVHPSVLARLGSTFAASRTRSCARKGIDYFENSRRATYVQQQYAIRNPLEFAGYGQHFWGLTASDGPGWTTAASARHRAPLLRLRRARRAVWPRRRHRRAVGCGRLAAIRPGDRAANGSALSGRVSAGHWRVLLAVQLQSDLPHEGDAGLGWTSPYHFGMNLGPVVLMCENYRSGLLWRLMRACPYVVTGLRRAGFTNGWL